MNKKIIITALRLTFECVCSAKDMTVYFMAIKKTNARRVRIRGRRIAAVAYENVIKLLRRVDVAL